jgi:hypothetical protein
VSGAARSPTRTTAVRALHALGSHTLRLRALVERMGDRQHDEERARRHPRGEGGPLDRAARGLLA